MIEILYKSEYWNTEIDGFLQTQLSQISNAHDSDAFECTQPKRTHENGNYKQEKNSHQQITGTWCPDETWTILSV